MSKIVIALGGNALGKSPEEQLLLLKDAVSYTHLTLPTKLEV